MRNFIIKTIHGDKITISEEEYESYLANKDDTVFFKDKGITLKKNIVALIHPENQTEKIEVKKKQMTGVLHDGQLVKRYFGEWVLSGKIAPDDNGDYQSIIIDPDYYPEIKQGCVPTQEEFGEIEHLPKEERLKFILNKHEELIGKRSGGMQKLKEVFKKLK